MKIENVIGVKKELSKDEFLRNVLKQITMNIESPANIMTAKFKSVEEHTTEILILQSSVNVEMSGSVGYDKEEQYQTTEKKFVNEGDRYIIQGVQKRADTSKKYEVDVIKTRTVTDWSPFNGTQNQKVEGVISTEDDKENELVSLFQKERNHFKDESLTVEDSMEIPTSVYKRAVSRCEFLASIYCTWPGDHHKDERYKYDTSVEDISLVILPYYEVKFEYEGNEYYAKGLACGEVNEVHQCPKSQNLVESEGSINTLRSDATEQLSKLFKIGPVLVIAIIIFSIIMLVGLFSISEPSSGGKASFITGLCVDIICGTLFAILQKKYKYLKKQFQKMQIID